MGMGHAGGSPPAHQLLAPGHRLRLCGCCSVTRGGVEWQLATTSFTLLDMCAPNGRGSGLRWEDDPTNFLVAFDPRMEH